VELNTSIRSLRHLAHHGDEEEGGGGGAVVVEDGSTANVKTTTNKKANTVTVFSSETKQDLTWKHVNMTIVSHYVQFFVC